MATGRKTGGRKKGVPNKLTSTARQAFLATFGKIEGDLEGWIRAAAEIDPGKGADLTLRMAEYHVPKMRAVELTGKDGGPVVIDFSVDLSASRKCDT